MQWSLRSYGETRERVIFALWPRYDGTSGRVFWLERVELYEAYYGPLSRWTVVEAKAFKENN